MRDLRSRRHARTGPAAQVPGDVRPDRPAKRRPPARDRHRLGRHGDARGRDQRLPRHHDHHLAAAKAAGRAADPRSRPGRPDRGAAVRLPRRAGAVRQDRLDRDVRGGRRGVLARVLRHLRPLAGTGRVHEPADDHDAARPVSRHPAKLHLGAQVHLPGRTDPIRAGDRRRAERRTQGCESPPATRSASTTRPRSGCGASASWIAGTTCAALGFDDTFRRTWEFYLAYCEAGFRSGAIGDLQMAICSDHELRRASESGSPAARAASAPLWQPSWPTAARASRSAHAARTDCARWQATGCWSRLSTSVAASRWSRRPTWCGQSWAGSISRS